MSKARLLVFTPTYDNLMRPETPASIARQETSVSYEWQVGYHNPFPGRRMQNVIAQYQRARQICLDGSYEAMLTVEHDMILPPDAIEKLYFTESPVVYGLYVLRHGPRTLNAWQYVNNKSLGMSLSLYPNKLKKFQARGWAEVSGVGWGCTLIHREVLERQEIHSNDEHDAGDLTFSMECLRNGFMQIARFDVPCGHITPEGTVLHPYQSGGIVARVLALQTFNANVGGQSLYMKKDRYYTIPPDVAFDLARGGYVSVTNGALDDQADGLPAANNFDDIEVERQQPDIAEREMAIDTRAQTRATRSPKKKTGLS